MGILNARLKLEPNETIRWRTLANRVLSSRITSGGQLVVTDRRVFFRPNRVDAMIGRKSWERPVDAVAGIKTVSRDRAVLAGGLRERLEIQTADGVEVFVVNEPENKVVELRELLGVT